MPGRIVVTQPTVTWPNPQSGKSEAEPSTFRLRNTGGSPVRIVALKPSCGCVRVQAEPLVVPAHGTSTVTAVPTPIQFGERTVAIEVQTDSLATPAVPLQIHVVGTQKPPFILAAFGDLTYHDTATADVREVTVTSLLPEVERHSPRLLCDLPFLKVSEAGTSDQAHPTVPGLVIREHTFDVTFASQPPASFQGEVRVVDPWVADHVIVLNIRGETTPPLRALPARLILSSDRKAGAERRNTLLVFSRDGIPAGGLSVKPEEPGSPLCVEAQQVTPGKNLARYLVRCRSDATVTPGVYHLVVHRPSSGDSVSVPVSIE